MRGIMELGRSAYLRYEKLLHATQHAKPLATEWTSEVSKENVEEPSNCGWNLFISSMRNTNEPQYKDPCSMTYLGCQGKAERNFHMLLPSKNRWHQFRHDNLPYAIVDLVIQPRWETRNLNMTPFEEEVWLWRSSPLTNLAPPGMYNTL